MLSPDGEAPYAKLHPAEAAYKVTACGMRPPLPPALPDPLRRLVEDCWQGDPTARPNMQQVRGAVGHHVLTDSNHTVLQRSDGPLVLPACRRATQHAAVHFLVRAPGPVPS